MNYLLVVQVLVRIPPAQFRVEINTAEVKMPKWALKSFQEARDIAD